MLKIKTDSNNQIDIENKSIEVSDKVSADGAVTITAKAPTEIKIIKATAAKAIVTEKGETPITLEDTKSVRRVFNVIRSPIAANIIANKKGFENGNSGLPNGKYTVQFVIRANSTQNNFPGVTGAVPEQGNEVHFELHLDSGVKFYRDVVPAIKKTPEWKSLVALYGNYFRFDFDDYADEGCHFFGNVGVTPHPTEEAPKVVTEQKSFGFFVGNEENDFELDLDNKDYAFEFGFEIKSGCGELYVNWQNFKIDPYSEDDPEHPTFTEYPMFFSAEESIGTIVDRFKTLHPELDYATRGAYYIPQNVKMPPTVKITDANKNDVVEDCGIYFYMEEAIGYNIVDQNKGTVSYFSVNLPQSSLTIAEIRNMAIEQNPIINELESGVVKDTSIVFNRVLNPGGLDDGNRISWSDADFEYVGIDTENHPGMLIEEIILQGLTPEA